MQDVHAIGGGGGGCGGGGGGAAASASCGLIFGDRRLRHHHHHQALKCPRCESVNTKFCYYNNYNLSQPRHFCKGCRRYWTKGGVLRNVPVGGGCRKSNKRSAKPKASTSPVTSAASVAPAADISNSGSSSDSTSNTTSTTATTTTSVTALSTPATNTTAADMSYRTSISDLKSIPMVLMNESSPTLSISTTTDCSPKTAGINPGFPSELTRFSAIPSGLSINFEPLIDHNPFTELGSLMELMAAGVRDERNNKSSCNNNNDHNNNSTSMVSLDGCEDTTTSFRRIGGGTDDDWFVRRLTTTAPEWQLDKIGGGGIEDVKVQGLSGGVLDQTVQFDLLQTRGVGGGSSSGCGVLAAGLDWQSGAPLDGYGQHQSQHQGWFDLPSTVDQANYWSQTTQWSDNDHHLFPPP